MEGGAWPYLAGVTGVAAATAAIALVTSRIGVPNLSVIYVLLVLWVGSRYGRGPAVVTSLVAFAAFDYFLVAPVGTFTVAGPVGLLELVLLLAAALVTGQLAASVSRTRLAAEASASESRQLYEVATAVLRLPDVGAGLDLLCEQGGRLASVTSLSLVAFDEGRPRPVAGRTPDADEIRQASWSFEHRQAIGCTLKDGRLRLMRARPPGADQLLVQPLTGGAVVARARPEQATPAELRMLGALLALAELLMERRRAILESERRRAAEASDSLKAAVLSSLSHELRSPIASLRAGITALASSGSGAPPEHRPILRGLDRETLRLDRLVGDLLTMSRLEAGDESDLAPCAALPEIVGAVLHRMRPRLAAFQLRLRVPAELPAVMADELQMDRVLTNLMENAIDWTEPGGFIEVAASERDGKLTVRVANQGPEIAPAELERVFEKFWTGRSGGSGLGLAICRRIVEAHGGTISVRNLRQGPCFTFTLPAAEVATPTP
ncbi:MAG: sensor histidine kinase [Candidatus Dormibacteraceae bacterium]